MAKDKERSINPAAQQRKLEKNRALKKSKAEQQSRRNEKLGRRNPERIQREIDDLKALESSGEIKPREKAILADLERDLRAVKKAREALGDKAPAFAGRPQRDGRNGRDGDHGDRNTVLGKRRYNGERKPHHNYDKNDGMNSASDTDESVRNIPMPRDTPPPIPQKFRRSHGARDQSNPNKLPVNPTTSMPQVEAKTTYSSAPQLRDLKKEAISRFVPTAVKRKQDAVKGTGGQLLEPEEMDRLEREGYLNNQQHKKQNGEVSTVKQADQPIEISTSKESGYPSDDDNDRGDETARLLAEEERRFEQELAMSSIDDDADADDDNNINNNDQTTSHDSKNHNPSSTATTNTTTTTKSSSSSSSLFSTLPKPRNSSTTVTSTPTVPKPVQIEEVEDEDA